MKQALEAALKAIAKRAESEETADYSMKFSQAALNIAHALATLANTLKQSA